MKNLAIQMSIAFLLSYSLQAFPVALDTIKDDVLVEGNIGNKDFSITKDTIKDEVTIRIDIDDEDYEYNFFGNMMRVGMLDFGISTYMSDNSLDLPDELAFMDQVLWRSMNIGLHIVNIKTGFGGDKKGQLFGVSTGLKISWNHYSMEKDYNLIRNAPDFESAIDYDVPPLKKNRLRGTYLQIPFLLEFNSNPSRRSKSLNLGVGYVHQFLLGSQYKYKSHEGTKLKTRGDFNLRKSMGMIEGRFGIGHLNFYVQYGLNHLFQDGNGPELTPINFGINLIPR